MDMGSEDGELMMGMVCSTTRTASLEELEATLKWTVEVDIVGSGWRPFSCSSSFYLVPEGVSSDISGLIQGRRFGLLLPTCCLPLDILSI
jgi:hypothetical protein